MEMILEYVIGNGGMQWLGWGTTAALILLYAKREGAMVELVRENTAAIVHLTTLFNERLPRGGA